MAAIRQFTDDDIIDRPGIDITVRSKIGTVVPGRGKTPILNAIFDIIANYLAQGVDGMGVFEWPGPDEGTTHRVTVEVVNDN